MGQKEKITFWQKTVDLFLQMWASTSMTHTSVCQIHLSMCDMYLCDNIQKIIFILPKNEKFSFYLLVFSGNKSQI